MSPTHQADDEVGSRPRVDGERELEILRATLDVLAEVGYDRLTMDAVATSAKASKATLYRRWHSKARLVIDALLAQKGAPTRVDTGSLRADLLGTFCAPGGLTDHDHLAVLSAVMTAVARDEEFAAAFRRDVVGPRLDAVRVLFERARERGEVGPDVDLDVLVPALAGIVLHRAVVLGETPTTGLVTEVVDQIVLPAARRGATTTAAPS